MMKQNPGEILELAYELYQKKDYKTSLEKYEWFFDNAVDIDSSYIGAKYRSLREWSCLAKDYEPAHQSLINKKNITSKLFQKNKSKELFRDFSRLCDVLNHYQEFMNVFLKLQDSNMEFTESIYIYIEDILIKNRKWELCNLYIKDSIEKYNILLAKFDELIRISNNEFNGEYNSIYEKQFEKDIQNLLWILKVGNRDNEINNIVSQLKNDLLKRNITYTTTK